MDPLKWFYWLDNWRLLIRESIPYYLVLFDSMITTILEIGCYNNLAFGILKSTTIAEKGIH